MAALPSTVAGFTVLPISYSSSSTHILYARPHIGSKKADKNSFPDGRTLFLVNVPPDATERELILLFKQCGTVERVVFDLEDE
jgi:ribosomal RNA-processing protein 7